MTKTIGLQLFVYSLILAGLSYLSFHFAPSFARLVFVTGLIGSVLCVVWALRAMLGHRGKALPILTLMPVSFVMLSQVVMAWSSTTEVGRQPTAALVTVLLVLSLAMLTRIAYAGVIFSGQGSGPGMARPEKAGSASPSNSGLRG